MIKQQGNATLIIVVVMGLLVVGGIVWSQSKPVERIVMDPSNTEPDETMQNENVMAESLAAQEVGNIADTGMEAQYLAYSAEALETGADKQRVLFFHASWCPTCKAADRDLLVRLSELPEDVVVYKADYDLERQLKQEYEIVTQHTFVLLDQAGEVLDTWIGGQVDELLTRLN